MDYARYVTHSWGVRYLVDANRLGLWAAKCLFPGTVNLVYNGLPVLSCIFRSVQAFAVYVFNFILSKFIVCCDGIEGDLPRALVVEYSNLHLTDSLKEAKDALFSQSGV